MIISRMVQVEVGEGKWGNGDMDGQTCMILRMCGRRNILSTPRSIPDSKVVGLRGRPSSILRHMYVSKSGSLSRLCPDSTIQNRQMQRSWKKYIPS